MRVLEIDRIKIRCLKDIGFFNIYSIIIIGFCCNDQEKVEMANFEVRILRCEFHAGGITSPSPTKIYLNNPFYFKGLWG